MIEYSNDLARNLITTALTYLSTFQLKLLDGVAINPDKKAIQKKMQFYSKMKLIKDNFVDEILKIVWERKTINWEEFEKEKVYIEERVWQWTEWKTHLAIVELDQKLWNIDLRSIIKINEIWFDILTEVDSIQGRKNLFNLKTDP